MRSAVRRLRSWRWRGKVAVSEAGMDVNPNRIRIVARNATAGKRPGAPAPYPLRMPQDVVLHLPPSARPPRLDGDAELVRAAARKLGRSSDSLSAVRPTKLSFDGRRGKRGWRLALRVWKRG